MGILLSLAKTNTLIISTYYIIIVIISHFALK